MQAKNNSGFITANQNLLQSHENFWFLSSALDLLVSFFRTRSSLISFEARAGVGTSADDGTMKPVASLLLILNFCMYVIVTAIGGWAINIAIDRAFIIGPELALPAHFHPILFPIGNFATGFFVIFALIAGVVGTASAIAGVNHIRFWNNKSLQPAASSAIIAWVLTLLAMGLACKEIELEGRNAKLRTMEAFIIILSATQLVYALAIHGIS